MDITQLEKRIKDLEKWKEERTRQQLSFPLDIQSINILNQNFMRITRQVNIETVGASSHTFIYYTGTQGNFNFEVGANTFIPYTVNTTNNKLTVTNLPFDDDLQVYFSTSDTAPSPIDTSGTTDYFIINSTGLTFEITTVQGSVGDIVDITTDGVGSQYIYFYQ